MKGILCEKRVYDGRMITHSHPHAQLVFPLQGEMDVNMERSEFIVDEKSVFLLPFGHEHSFKVDGKNQFLIMDIPSYMFEMKKMDLSDGIKCEFNEKWKAIRFLLLDEMHGGLPSGDALSKLFYYFIPDMVTKKEPPSIQYIQEHYNQNIDIETLARIENYSVTYYGEWFKKETGMSPVEFIQIRRIDRAKELLQGTSLSIMQIACEVGYDYESSFTKVFKLREKVSPKVYRQSRT